LGFNKYKNYYFLMKNGAKTVKNTRFLCDFESKMAVFELKMTSKRL